jgi:hypothetical protein
MAIQMYSNPGNKQNTFYNVVIDSVNEKEAESDFEVCKGHFKK